MPRAIVLDYQGEVSEMPLTRIDRTKLYGRKVRMVTDENGEACTTAYLSSDGSTLVPANGFSMTYVDEAGNTVERTDLLTVDADGEILDKLPSTLGVAHEAFGPVDPQRVLDHVTTSVYQLEADSIGTQLSDALDRGEIFEAEFRYTTSTSTNTLFVLRNEAGTFGLVCQPVEFPFLEREAEASAEDLDEEDDSEELDDELDFSF